MADSVKGASRLTRSSENNQHRGAPREPLLAFLIVIPIVVVVIDS
jgi:hypothetical protein